MESHLISHDDDCIVAQCTPSGKGALALLRTSGINVRSLLKNMTHLASGKTLTEVPTHTIHYGSLMTSSQELIDQVMIIVMDGPRTFTGQDVIEITCHNNPFLIHTIINEIIKRGARHAQEGEFARRAFHAGKLDLVQAEAIHELIGAQTQHALKASLAQLEGSLSHWIHAIEKEMFQAVAWCEASFEFLDEEVAFRDRIAQRLNHIIKNIAQAQRSFNAQQQIRQGVRIALIGSVNTGKSSLFNMLLHQQRAIVSDIPGTTRDAIEAGITVEGNSWTLIDTAGMRSTNDIIEQEGIKRSLEEAHKADLILLVVDGSRPLTDQEYSVYTDILNAYPQKYLLIHHKADKPVDARNQFVKTCAISVSALTDHNRESLEHLIQQKINRLFESLDAPFLLNSRQHKLLVELKTKLENIRTHMSTHPHYELISYHLQDALTTLSELTGKSISEAALDTVFKEFCVGK